MAKKRLVTKESTTSLEEFYTEMCKKNLSQLTEMGRDVLINSILLKRIDLRKEIPSIEDVIDLQEKLVSIDEQIVDAMKNELEKHTVFLNKKEREHLAAKEEFKKAKERLIKAEEIIMETNDFHNLLQNKLETAENNREKDKETLDQMQVMALVHLSASLKQLQKYQLAKIAVTEADNIYLCGIMPDIVFQAEKVDNFIEFLPKDFETRYDEETRKSILDFCNLVINVKLATPEEQKIVVLFANKDIAEILKLNGMEDF